MAIFTVTTAADTTDETDGDLSLREALTAARGAAGADIIRFAQGLREIELSSRLFIYRDEGLTIDGDTNGDNFADISLTFLGERSSSVILFRQGSADEFAAPAPIALQDIRLDGVQRNVATASSSGPAAAGEDGRDAFDSGRIVAAFEIRAPIVLDGVTISNVTTPSVRERFEGQAGGAGINGGDGADGRSGSIDGGRGTAGGPGGAGGAGGDSSTIAMFYSTGSVTLRNVVMDGTSVLNGSDGGPGGAGGAGGDGGDGGDGAGSFARGGDGGRGGNAGDGGDGGTGGKGGDVVQGIFLGSGGTITEAMGVIIAENEASAAGAGGAGGAGGAAGGRGSGGTGAGNLFNGGDNGARGSAGSSGDPGATGPAGRLLTGVRALDGTVTLSDTPDFIVYTRDRAETVNEGGSISFSVIRGGDTGANFTLDWQVGGAGITAGDFEGGLTGQLEFTAGGPDLRTVTLNLADDGRVEGDESFDFFIGNITFTSATDLVGGFGDQSETTMIIDGPGRIIGNNQANRLLGGPLGDRIEGLNGPDTLNGFGGDDTILGGRNEQDRGDLIFGGDGNDSIDGGHGNDRIFGQAGNDTLIGGFGADQLQGQEGDDQISGGALGDEIFGGDGMDFINGGFGFDRVNGGNGADSFYHLGVRNHGSDWIQDFDSEEGDKLVFGNAAVRASDFQVNYATTAGAGAAGAQEAFVIYRPDGRIIWALVDGGAERSIDIQIGGQTFDLLA
ncbi:calcium-binding protein [Jannaschia sp. M317]|uniref:calcium-binding protein n=1 Tax=Jannaschia sp. M317 TaxID=2867011 RepID=UPI00220F6FEE|nr:calcium-binding protein [Jannaschia sp. M317]UWQ18465.1 hypothetical protein K3551_03960 [Jannaschia sp. M317]